MDIKILKLRDSAIIPTRATFGSAGYDLHACLNSDVSISCGQLLKIPCGFAIETPFGFSSFIFSRSGLATKYGICLANGVGVVDSDYRGELQVCLTRISDGVPYVIHHGDRIAQLIVMKVESLNFVPVSQLSDSSRGNGGFGSTGF